MDIQSTAKNILGKLEDNAAAVAFASANYLRYRESTQDNAEILNRLMRFYTFQATAVDGDPVSNVIMSISSPTQLKYKLWDAPHYSTGIFKAAAIVWAIGKITGMVPTRYEKLAGKVALGAGLAALILPGSGPKENTIARSVSTNFNAAPLTTSYEY